MIPRRGFRTRLVVTLIGIVAATVIGLGIGAYLFVSSSLRSQLVDEAIDRTNFNLAVLATEWLDDDPTAAEYTESPLDQALRLRGDVEVFADFGDGDTYASKPAFLITPSLVSTQLEDILSAGDVGLDWVRVEENPYLMAAGSRPPAGPVFYFFYPAVDLEDGLARLRQALTAGGILLVLAGALAGNWIARRVLRPVRRASEAALAIAGGDLTARLEADSPDEFGSWAQAFNSMAASLEETIGRLEEARARERRFTADVSHELRTPLTGLVQEAALVREHLERMPGEPQRVGELLAADVDRIRRLVDDLLEISRMDAGVQPTTLEMVNLRPFVDAVVADRLPQAEVSGGEDGIEVRIDRRRLERIVGNLLDNARLHGMGRQVEVTIDRNHELVLRVADRGPGVDPDRLDLLFERFAKAEPSRTGSGSGLGLAIARQHARQLGGDLTAALRPGGGLVFELRLPL